MLGTLLSVIGVLVLAVLLFTIHEFGHYVCALLLGVPRQNMQLHVITSLPPRVEFLGVSGFAEVDTYLPQSGRRLTGAMFVIAAGGHIAEVITAIGLVATGLILGYEWFATRYVLLSTFVTVSYLLVTVFALTFFDEDFGDPIALWRRSIPATVAFYVAFLGVMSGLLWVLDVSRETIVQFGIIVPLLFVPMAMMAVIHD